MSTEQLITNFLLILDSDIKYNFLRQEGNVVVVDFVKKGSPNKRAIFRFNRQFIFVNIGGDHESFTNPHEAIFYALKK